MTGLTGVAIDIGSGMTKVMSVNQQHTFPSTSGIPMEGQFQVNEDPKAMVSWGDQTYCVGEKALAMVNPKKIVDATTDKWAGTDGYRALLYGALGRVLPDGFDGRLALCTGLPVSIFNKAKEDLSDALCGTHKFQVGEHKYRVLIRRPNLMIVPQAVGMYFWALKNIKDLNESRVGFIDVGTYTTGWVMAENYDLLAWASGGHRTGVSNVRDGLQTEMLSTHQMNCTRGTLDKAIRTKKINIAAQKNVPLIETLNGIAMREAAHMIGALQKDWGPAKEADIFVGGGGGETFLPAIKTRYPHAQLLPCNEAIYAVVEGYYSWLDRKLQAQQKATGT